MFASAASPLKHNNSPLASAASGSTRRSAAQLSYQDLRTQKTTNQPRKEASENLSALAHPSRRDHYVRTCPAITSPLPSSPQAAAPLHTDAPETPDRVGGVGGNPRRLNALAPADWSKDEAAPIAPAPRPVVCSASIDIDPPPNPSQPGSALIEGGRGPSPCAGVGAPVVLETVVLPTPPPRWFVVLCSLFWLWMVW